MSEPLLLVPGKPEEVCGDVRPVLQEVFRDAVYPAGPLGSTTPSKEAVAHNILNVVSGASDNNKLVAENWATKYQEECKELRQHEDELKKEYAQKLSRGAPLNTYKLHRRDDKPDWCAPQAGGRGACAGGWRLQRGLLERRDLLPMVQQNAAGEESLWVRSLLARSSSAVPAATLPPPLPGSAPLPALDPIAQACACSMQSVSMGLEPVPVVPARPPPPPAPLAPQYIVCDPPELHFVNFDVGKLYMARVRIVNVTKQQVRVALRAPPPPLHVLLCGPSPLTLRAGATGTFEVQFRPRSVLSVRDEVRVRASLGRALAVRVYCYMEPPQLHILVGGAATTAHGRGAARGSCAGGPPDEVIDLGARLLGDEHVAPLLMAARAPHADFFILTEDEWLTATISEAALQGVVEVAGFTLRPAWWRGGGTEHGAVWGSVRCRAACPGLHVAALRVLSSTAVVRALTLLADTIMYSADHVTIEGQEKNFSITAESDAGCQHYVNLGEAFPGDDVSGTVQVVNHSSVWYAYRWETRPWGVCSCDDTACDDATSDLSEGEVWRARDAATVQAQPTRATLPPRSATPVALQARAPRDPSPTMHRAVLVLILTAVPTVSVPPECAEFILEPEIQSYGNLS